MRLRRCCALERPVDRDPRALLPAAARRPVAESGRGRALRGAVSRLERAHRAGVLPRRGRGARARSGRAHRTDRQHPGLDQLQLRRDPARVAGARGAGHVRGGARGRPGEPRAARRARQRDRHAVPPRHHAARVAARQGHRGALGDRGLSPSLRTRPRGNVASRDGGRSRDAGRAGGRGDRLHDPRAASGRAHAGGRIGGGRPARGVERWRADCGCRMAPERPTQQRWRAPLREALDWLAGELHARFEREGALFDDPWAARDAYGTVVGGASAGLAQFVAQRLRPGADRTAEQRARELLELERNALRMFTSCGWFFDDIAGIETIQILRYAARAIELAGADAPRLEAGVLERLARAHSNEPGEGTGRDVYLNHVQRRVPVEAVSRTDAQAGDPGGDAARALLRAVLALEHDHSPRATAVVTELADRAQRDGGHIPFDAQTAFYRIRAAAPPGRAAQLASVAWRLRFAGREGEGEGAQQEGGA